MPTTGASERTEQRSTREDKDHRFVYELRKKQAMSAQENIQSNARLTISQQTMVKRWEEHLRNEFELRNVDKTMETMVDNPYVTVVPVLTGGIGQDGVREFYTKWFIP